MKSKLWLRKSFALCAYYLIIHLNSAMAQAPSHYPPVPCATACTTTNENELMQKYWNYRDRFRKFFVRIGKNNGEGLPVSSNEINDNALTSGKMNWGDTGPVLGDYMAVLASEYKLLKEQQRDDEALVTLNELYYVLYAIDRLDEKAENYLSQGQSAGSQNGFFIRDDVYTSFSHFWSDNYSTTDDLRDALYHEASSYNNEGANTFNPENEATQDQVIGILFGLAHVVKFLDNGNGNQVIIQPTSTDYPHDILQWSKDIAGRILHYVSKVKTGVVFNSQRTWRDLCDVAEFTGDATWVITNPITNNMVVNEGGWSQGFSYALASTGEFITGDNSFMLTPITIDGSIHYTAWWCLDMGQVAVPPIPLSSIGALWMELENTDQDLVSNITIPLELQQPFVSPDLAGISHAISYVVDLCGGNTSINLGSGTSNYNIYMMLSLAATASTNYPHWSQQYIKHVASDFWGSGDRWGMKIFDIDYAALHHVFPLISQAEYKTILESAPCAGPYNYWEASGSQDPNSYDPIWNDKSVWGDPKSPANDGHRQKGDENGLDYMLLYNLYQIAFKNQGGSGIPDYKNTACPCNNQGSIATAMASQNNHQVVTIKRKFTEYQNFNPPIELPEYISADVTLSYGNKIQTLNCHSEIKTCNNATITVKNDGYLNIGNNPNNQDDMGILRVTSGCALLLKSGCHVTINDKSKIIIEPGGHFIYEAGAQIILQGKDAMLEVQDANTAITLNSGEQMILDQGTATEGGTMQLAGGSFTINAQSAIANTNCKLMLSAPLAFQVQPNVSFILIGEKALVDVLASTTITIGNGKTISLTGFNSGKHGELYLHNGTFNLQSGGTIYSEQCCLHLGAGMNINYDPNSTIQLDGDDAVLDIGGNLVLLQDAVFKFIWNQYDYNSGYIRMSGVPDWNIGGCKNLWCGTNCKFALQGAGKNDKILEIAQETLYDPACALHGRGQLVLFSLISGKVEFAGGPALGFS